MTLDHQANTTSTMVYGDNNSNKTFFGRPNNTMMNQNVPSSPLLTYSYLNSNNSMHNNNPNNGSFKGGDSLDHIPQLSMSLMELSLNQDNNNLHHDISTSTSPNKLPFNNNIQPTHQQSLSLDSNGSHQRDLSPRFDVPFAARQRGNSSGFPPIGGHLTSKY